MIWNIKENSNKKLSFKFRIILITWTFFIFRKNLINVNCVLNLSQHLVIWSLTCMSTVVHGLSNVLFAPEASPNKRTLKIIYFFIPVSLKFVLSLNVSNNYLYIFCHLIVWLNIKSFNINYNTICNTFSTFF